MLTTPVHRHQRVLRRAADERAALDDGGHAKQVGGLDSARNFLDGAQLVLHCFVYAIDESSPVPCLFAAGILN